VQWILNFIYKTKFGVLLYISARIGSVSIIFRQLKGFYRIYSQKTWLLHNCLGRKLERKKTYVSRSRLKVELALPRPFDLHFQLGQDCTWLSWYHNNSCLATTRFWWRSLHNTKTEFGLGRHHQLSDWQLASWALFSLDVLMFSLDPIDMPKGYVVHIQANKKPTLGIWQVAYDRNNIHLKFAWCKFVSQFGFYVNIESHRRVKPFHIPTVDRYFLPFHSLGGSPSLGKLRSWIIPVIHPSIHRNLINKWFTKNPDSVLSVGAFLIHPIYVPLRCDLSHVAAKSDCWAPQHHRTI